MRYCTGSPRFAGVRWAGLEQLGRHRPDVYPSQGIVEHVEGHWIPGPEPSLTDHQCLRRNCRAVGDYRCRVVGPQVQPRREGECAPGGERRKHCGDHATNEDAGQGADSERRQCPGRKHNTKQIEQGRRQRSIVVAGAEDWLDVPGDQQGERAGSDRDGGCERHHGGDRPSSPPESLSPRVAERAGLQFSGQHGRAGKRPDQGGDSLQQPEDPANARRVGVQETTGHLLANGGSRWTAGRHGPICRVHLKAGDQQIRTCRRQQRDDSRKGEPVLPPDDPRHPAPRQRPEAHIPLHGQRYCAQLPAAIGCEIAARIGPGNAAAAGSRI